MRLLRFITLGVVAYGLFLLVTLPASLVTTRVALETRGAVRLADVEGTLWRGRARAVLSLPRTAPIPIDGLEWRFNPWRLLGAELSFFVRGRAAGTQGELEVVRGFSGWSARQLLVEGDIASVASLAPFVSPWAPAGAFKLTAPALGWNGRELLGEATAEVRNAATSLSEVRPLGAYRLRLQGAGGPAKLSLTTIEGALRLSAEGTLSPPSTLALAGDARADGPYAKTLEPLLSLIGPRRPDGAHAIDWRTR